MIIIFLTYQIDQTELTKLTIQKYVYTIINNYNFLETKLENI